MTRNLGQTMCKRCRRYHYACIAERCISDEVFGELVNYALKHGRTWKAQLREEWMHGNDTLRWARNIIGSRRLAGVKLGAKRFARR